MKNDQDDFLNEFRDYLDEGFKVVLTEDQSPTLIQKGLSEEMHSKGGALLESVFIYFSALELFFRGLHENEEVEVLSIGTGLGYNEVLTVISHITAPEKASYSIKSYEKKRCLIELFQKRLHSHKSFNHYWSIFENFKVDPSVISKTVLEKCEFKNAFNKVSLGELKKMKRIILFDAYSNKTSEELWDEDFLVELLSCSQIGSVITTYAATGSLNRALKKTGFKNLKRGGFSFKRQSTLAVKTEEPI